MSNMMKYASYFKEAKNLEEEVSGTFEKIENGEITPSKDRYVFVKMRSDIKRIFSFLNKINTIEIEREANDKKFVSDLKERIRTLYENAEYIQKRLTGYEYIDDLYVPIKHYLEQFMGDESNYKKWATNTSDLAKKFAAMLTRSEYVDEFKNQIRRIAIGTMNLKEFKKIFETNKHKMIPLSGAQFESFTEYKNYNYEA